MLDRPRSLDERCRGRHDLRVSEHDPWTSTDPLGVALRLLRVDGAFYCWSELSAPWGFSLPPMPGYMWFHALLAGALMLQISGEPRRNLTTGQLALVPRGKGHALLSEAGVPIPDILTLDREQVSDRYELLRYGGGGAPTALVCGAVRLEHPAARRLVGSLPPCIVIDERAPGTESIQNTLRLLGNEARHTRPGGEAILTRLADVIVIQALRAWLDGDPSGRAGWLGALRDPQIGRALALVHDDPARQWTVAALADHVSMSRSSFAARFTELVGEPAMQYLTTWRMQLALTALREGDATVAQVADQSGYRSEAAFARAFKRVNGFPPGVARRHPDSDLGLAPA